MRDLAPDVGEIGAAGGIEVVIFHQGVGRHRWGDAGRVEGQGEVGLDQAVAGFGIHPRHADIQGGAGEGGVHLVGVVKLGQRQHEGGQAGDVRGGHRGARKPAVAVFDVVEILVVKTAGGGGGGEHARARGGHVQLAADVGIQGGGVAAVDSGHGDDPGVFGRVQHRPAAGLTVARGGHEGGAALIGVVGGGFQQARGDGRAQAEVNHLGPVVIHGKDNAARHADQRTAAFVVQHTHRQDLGVPGHAGDADAVVGAGGGDPGHVGAVPAAVLGIGVVADEVIPRQQAAGKLRVRPV